jgi:hypothetical protein
MLIGLKHLFLMVHVWWYNLNWQCLVPVLSTSVWIVWLVTFFSGCMCRKCYVKWFYKFSFNIFKGNAAWDSYLCTWPNWSMKGISHSFWYEDLYRFTFNWEIVRLLYPLELIWPSSLCAVSHIRSSSYCFWSFSFYLICILSFCSTFHISVGIYPIVS